MQESVKVTGLDIRMPADEHEFSLVAPALEPHVPRLLTSYYYMRRGSVHGVLIDCMSYIKDTTASARFEVRFKVNFNQGCQDINYDVDESMCIGMNFAESGIILSGETVPERDGEEF